jgi:undecaprenyl-phosphate galactose phosphotransferase
LKEIISKIVLLVVDLLTIIISIIFAYYIRTIFDSSFTTIFSHSLTTYLYFAPLYLVTLSLLAYEGIYTKRHDFWHESRQIIKAISLAFLFVLAFLAMTKSVEEYSRATIFFTFVLMAFFIPLFKNITKKLLFSYGLWGRPAKIYDESTFIRDEIYKNPYLGYIETDEDNAKTVFINSKSYAPEKLQALINSAIQSSKEVIFIPLINEYNLTQSYIYELSNTRTNLIVLKNRLKSRSRMLLHNLFNYFLALLLLPILLPVIALLAYLIKKESPGPVFFAHMRIGKDGKAIPTLKFRSMYSDAKERLEKLLAEDPAIKAEWEKNFKLKDDPRVTKIGAIMRKTSLDELPQIFNVLKGEMSFVGPRPVIQQEIDQYYKEDAQYYFMVKPGITGLWQVSGRSDTDYDFRVETDKWYVLNWSIWLDIVILFKTVKVVLFREGAY